jgi:hypothetical protein
MNCFPYKETHFFDFIQFPSFLAQLCILVAHPVGKSFAEIFSYPAPDLWEKTLLVQIQAEKDNISLSHSDTNDDTSTLRLN